MSEAQINRLVPVIFDGVLLVHHDGILVLGGLGSVLSLASLGLLGQGRDQLVGGDAGAGQGAQHGHDLVRRVLLGRLLLAGVVLPLTVFGVTSVGF